MSCCDTCGVEMAGDNPFRDCPQCLFGEALTAGDEMPEERAVINSSGSAASSPELWSRLPPCRDFFQKYEVLERVGRGGQGDVLKVWDFQLRRSVAMKRLGEEAMHSEPAVYRFLAEAQITSQLEHPGILAVYDIGLDPDGKPFYTIPLLPGTTLADVWARVRTGEGEWTLNRALELLVRVCEVMAHAHSRGVIHRDIKPSNVLVGAFGEVRMIDWGSAHVLQRFRKSFEASLVPLDRSVVRTDRGEALWADPDSPLATAHSGQPITVLFMPPEILSGSAGEPGPETDVYSLGVMLYELLAGRAPYSNRDGSLPAREELQARILKGPPDPVRILNSRVSKDLAAICHKAMSYDLSGRYTSMESLAADFRAVLEVRPVQAREPGPLLVLQKWAARNLGYVLLGGLMLIVASGGLAINQGLKAQRDLARRFAVVSEALGQAELAARNGEWRAALEGLDKAEAAGYRDPVHLGLRRAEAWTVLSQPERAHTELTRLVRRTDLGERRGGVLLRLGEHELFDASRHEQGVGRVREAMAAGLDAADLAFANGLLAESTPQALESFRQTLQLNPFHYGAHRQSLGLEHLLGRRQELAEHIRVFQTLFPDDPSAAFIAATELALHGNLAGAEATLDSVRAVADPAVVNRLRNGARLLALASEFYDLEVQLGASSFDHEQFNLVFAEVSTPLAGSDSAGAPFSLSQFRLPYLPCVQTGIHEALEAIQTILMPLWGDLDSTLRKIKSSWRHHPEALLPMFAATTLDARHPREGAKSLSLLSIQADLFQMAADSPSVLPSLGRTARYRAARTHFELAGRGHPNSEQARGACLANVREASRFAGITATEGRAYFEMAFALGDYDLARDVLKPWQHGKPEDPDVARARVQLDIATGALGGALEQIDGLLAENPADPWALEQRRVTLKKLSGILESNPPSNQPIP